MKFDATMGAEAVHELLRTIDFSASRLAGTGRYWRYTNSETKIKRLSKRLKLLEAFLESGNRAGVDGANGFTRIAARSSPFGAARWGPVRDVRFERSLSAGHQPQQSAAQAIIRAECARHHRSK